MACRGWGRRGGSRCLTGTTTRRRRRRTTTERHYPGNGGSFFFSVFFLSRCVCVSSDNIFAKVSSEYRACRGCVCFFLVKTPTFVVEKFVRFLVVNLETKGVAVRKREEAARVCGPDRTCQTSVERELEPRSFVACRSWPTPVVPPVVLNRQRSPFHFSLSSGKP